MALLRSQFETQLTPPAGDRGLAVWVLSEATSTAQWQMLCPAESFTGESLPAPAPGFQLSRSSGPSG